MIGLRQYIMEDMPEQVAILGNETAFYAMLCGMQLPLIIRTYELGTIFPEPCCTSLYHGFPSALGIEDRIMDGTNMRNDGFDIGRLRPLEELIEEIRQEIAARGASGRLSTWPVPASMMFTIAATKYAIKWLNGEVVQR